MFVKKKLVNEASFQSPNVISIFSCGVGTYYGTLGGIVPAMSNVRKIDAAYKSPGKNVLTNPSKKGTGYG